MNKETFSLIFESALLKTSSVNEAEVLSFDIPKEKI